MDKELAKEALFKLVDILEKNNIKYCLSCGTLLGAIREKNFIDHDNDIDLFIFDRFWYNDKLLQVVVSQLLKSNFYIGSLLNNATLHLIYQTDVGDISIDLYQGYKKENKYYFEGNGYVSIFSAKHLDTLDELKFLDRDFKVPHNPKKFLTEYFNGDWTKPTLSDSSIYKALHNHDLIQKINFPFYLKIYRDVIKEKKPTDD